MAHQVFFSKIRKLKSHSIEIPVLQESVIYGMSYQITKELKRNYHLSSKKLISFFYLRLSKIFNKDDICSFKKVCVKCRCFNALNSYTC